MTSRRYLFGTARGSTAWIALTLAWVIALTASLGALFVGEIMGQEPCALCWYQRAFMFPLAVILAIAAFRSDFDVWRYALPLAILGSALAGYHVLLFYEVIEQAIQPCSAVGPSCSDAAMTILGGMPLPLLSAGAFASVAALLLLTQVKT